LPSQTPTRSRRKPILLTIGAVLLFGIIFSQAAFNLKFLSPDTLEQTFVFAAVSAVIFLGLVALTFVLLRTLAKLYLEQQAGVLGSKFRTKMVLGALVLSFGPVIALFVFSYGLMNRSIDKWFSRPVEEVRERTSVVTDLLAGYAGRNALAEAQAIAAMPETERAYRSGSFGPMLEQLRRRQMTLQGGFAVALLGDHAQAVFHSPLPWYELQTKLPVLSEETAPSVVLLNGRDYILATTKAGENGRVVVGLPLPAEYSETLRSLDESQRKYTALRGQRKLIRQTYMQILLLITLLVLFASTWFALFLSKLVTRPVMALAQATQEISSGRLDYRVQVQAGDELATLVRSFNEMASELESNRRQIDASQKQLADANEQVDQRRRQLETILESIPTGVLSMDSEARVTRVNAALLRMFQPREITHAGRVSELSLAELFDPETTADLVRMMRKADRMGTTSGEMEIARGAATMHVGVTLASMTRQRPLERLGYVVVFEDLSDLLKAQKQTAWREVARRIAHEIKNPLTPITLSAERIRRYLNRGRPDEASLAIIHGCAETIAGAAETVRKLVDEFSIMARFPQSQPEASDLNALIESALSLFAGRLDGIILRLSLSPHLPPITVDADGLKRVVVNLVDNAAEAMSDSMVREITISTAVLPGRDAVELVVADTGHGVTPELKEKLFLPYFSTKQRGTGLGLAIVSRIIEDHRGSIRVEENHPVGTRFIVELPLESLESVKQQSAVSS
jgi:nitrogen fixation/metabolism regulation signal transduction histidine kinase